MNDLGSIPYKGTFIRIDQPPEPLIYPTNDRRSHMISAEALQKLRQAIAAEYEIALYRQYCERDAARFWSVDVSTVKRWRRQSQLPFIEMPNGGIKYFGFHIVDVLLFGKGARDYEHEDGVEALIGSRDGLCPSMSSERSSAASGTSASDGTRLRGTGLDTTPSLVQPTASASAQLTKLLRKND